MNDLPRDDLSNNNQNQVIYGENYILAVMFQMQFTTSIFLLQLFSY